jgi:hypothetical protein
MLRAKKFGPSQAARIFAPTDLSQEHAEVAEENMGEKSFCAL